MQGPGVGRRAWILVAATTGVGWWTAVPADAWHAKASATPSCTEHHARLEVDFANDEPPGGRAMTVGARDQQTGMSLVLGTVAPGTHVTGTIDPGRATFAPGTVTFSATWSAGPPATVRVTVKYAGVDCRAPAPVLADGINGVSLLGLGLGAVAGPASVYWRRRRRRLAT